MRLQHKTLKNVSFFIRNVHQTKGNWRINGMCQRKKWFRFVFVCSASAKEWWMAAHKADSQCPQITLNYIRKERKNSKPFFCWFDFLWDFFAQFSNVIHLSFDVIASLARLPICLETKKDHRMHVEVFSLCFLLLGVCFLRLVYFTWTLT